MTRKAVLCGINNYPFAPLKGCINDVENVHQLLVQTFGFFPQEIHVLKDNQVVKPNVLKEWQWLTSGAQIGDILVFHFSGHGSHVPDRSGDEQDLRDEISCLYDMDFNNPATYLSDDEWYELATGVNPSANLIIIKDTCHSGGSSRFLGVRAEDGKDRIVLADIKQHKGHFLDEEISERSVTNARFLVPPDLPAEAWHGGEGAAVGVKTTRLPQTHQTSLMACRETQTAADDYISGHFNGAFTYHLCEALRNNLQLSSRHLIDIVVQQLQGRYEQVPQHEGKELPAPIFGSPSEISPARIDASITSSSDGIPLIAAAPAGLQATQQMLFQAYNKLLDTVVALQTGIPAAKLARTGRRVLVAVHGIGTHHSGYSNKWWQALVDHVGTTFEPSVLGQGRHEVVWSDLVNQSRQLARSIDPDQVKQLRQAILDVIEDRRDQVAARTHSPDQLPTMRGGAIAIDDFLIYMVDDNMRRQIIQRFTEVVAPLLASGATLEIISHSWGTVVAYEGLRELEQRSGLSGRVSNWFTVGSALSIAPVQWRLRPENRPQGGRLAPYPALVDTWINLDADGDLVGGRLGRRFPVTKEYLNLLPVSCQRQFWGYDLGCAHGSYFNIDNLQVNRDIFAAHMLSLA